MENRFYTPESERAKTKMETAEESTAAPKDLEAKASSTEPSHIDQHARDPEAHAQSR